MSYPKVLVSQCSVDYIRKTIRKNHEKILMKIDCMEEQRYREPKDFEICSKWLCKAEDIWEFT